VTGVQTCALPISLGHIMISYPNTISADDIRKDLVHLLKYSWAG